MFLAHTMQLMRPSRSRSTSPRLPMPSRQARSTSPAPRRHLATLIQLGLPLWGGPLSVLMH